MPNRRASRPVRRLLPWLVALSAACCKSPPPAETMYAGEAQAKPVKRRSVAPVQPPRTNASGVIVAPEDCRGSFGDAIAVRGSLVVVGAPRAGEAGKAWVYDAEHLDRPPVCLLPPPGVQGERFGAAVSVSPGLDRIVVGAPFAEVHGLPESGRLYLWRRDGERWRFERTFTDPDPDKGAERLGRSVMLDGTSVIAGAPNATMELRDDVQVEQPPTRSVDPLDEPGTVTTRTESRLRGRFEREGAVLIWNIDPAGAWSGPQYALLPRGRPAARFGTALARHTLSGEDLLAVSAPPQRTKTGFEVGTVSIFMRRVGASWRGQGQILIAPQRGDSSDLFGSCIALGDNLLAVGVPQANLDVAVDAGKVIVFQRDVETRNWSEGVPALHAPAIEVGSGFGNAVAVMGRLLVVGQPRATRPDGTGRAFVFAKSERPSQGERSRKLDPDDPNAQPWQPIAELVAPPFVSARNFGGALATGDDWVAVAGNGDGPKGCVALYRIDRSTSGIVSAPTTPPAEPSAPTTPPAPAQPSTPTTTEPSAEPAPTSTTPPPTVPAEPKPAMEPQTLTPGANRPGPLPTSAEPASLYEVPPETPAVKPSGARPAAPSAPPTSSGSPYETPPETPGTKP